MVPAVVVLVAYYLTIAPFSKVEESFNIQAIHDIFNYGVLDPSVIRSSYDHSLFLGPVPRTFVGSLVIAGLARLLSYASSLLGMDIVHSPIGSQLPLLDLCRGILGVINVWGFYMLARSLERINARRNKGIESCCFLALLCTQFHLLYYSSRTLPNFMALPLVLFAVSQLVQGRMIGLAWLSFTGIVFRLEIGLLAGLILLVSSLVFKQSSFMSNLYLLVSGLLVGIAVSCGVDSYFWGRWLLPELNSFIFNVVQGKSAEWGTEPYGAYFTKYLWQLFKPPIILVLMLVGLSRDPAASNPASRNSLRILTTAAFLYIAVMSLQPHKEWRFIVYVAPIFSLPAAVGFGTILRLRSRLALLFKILLLLTCILGISLSMFMGYASSFNYPGGEALTRVNHLIAEKYQKPVTVHMDVLPCMSGATLFHTIHDSQITFDKTETASDIEAILLKSDIWISQNKDCGPQWKLVFTIDGFTAVRPGKAIGQIKMLLKSPDQVFQLLRKPLLIKTYFELLILTEPTIYVHERYRDMV